MKKTKPKPNEQNIVRDFDAYLKKYSYFIPSFLFVVGSSIYINSAWGDFVFDDSEAIVNNDDVQGTVPFWKLFYNDFWGSLINQNYSHKSYRPLTVITFRWNVLLFGKSALSFHIINIILHGLCSSLSYHIIRILLHKEKPSICFMSALLFTVHPIHCESVAGIVGRADLLAALLGFISIIVYQQCCRSSSTLNTCILSLVSSMLCVLAMFCKEQGITFLGLLIVYDLIVVQNLAFIGHKFCLSKPHCLRLFYIRQTVLILVTSGALYLRWIIMGSAPPQFKPFDNPASFHENFIIRVINYNYIYTINIWLLICPEWLCNDWSMGSIPLIETCFDYRLFFVLLFWISMFTLVVKCILSVLYRNRKRNIIMALSILIIPFIPASNILFRVGFVIAERNLYIPSLGYCILITLGLRKIFIYFENENKIRGVCLSQVCLIYLVFILSVRTIQRNSDWADEISLYRSAIKVSPLNAKMYFNLGRQSAELNNKNMAVHYYQEAIRLNPTYSQAMNNLANLLRIEQPDYAEILFNLAVQYEPELSSAWNNLGILLNSQKRFAEAEKCYLNAVSLGRLRKKKADYLYNLGNMFLDMGEKAKALNTWLNVTRLDPYHVKSWHNMIIMFDSLGNFSKSVMVAERALQLNPKEAALHADAAYSLGQLKRFKEAEFHYKTAIQLRPNIATYHANFGVFYQLIKEYDKAEEEYKTALAIDPTSKKVQDNYASLKKERSLRSRASQSSS